MPPVPPPPRSAPDYSNALVNVLRTLSLLQQQSCMGTISKKNGNNEYGPSGLAHQWRREGGGGGSGVGGHMPPGAGRGGGAVRM